MLSDGMWSGSPCLIVGGGPSLRGWRGWDRLTLASNPWRTIAINRVAERQITGDEDLWLGVDSVFWRKCPDYLRDETCGKTVWIDTGDKRPDVDVVLPCAAPLSTPNRHNALVWGRTLSEGVGVGGNSGFAALNLAEILGADPIYLLGFDLRGENGKTANFHDGYTHSKPANESIYDTFLESFRWASRHVRSRVVVLEVEKGDSRLDCWEKRLAREVL